MGLGEQREDAVRVVGRDRQAVLRRQVSVHDRGLRPLGGVVDGERVLEPGRVPGQLGEPRISLGVEAILLVHQGVGRQLVEQHDDDRSLGHTADGASPGLLGEGELRHRRPDQEQQQEHERRGRQDVEEGAERLRPGVEGGQRDPDGHGQADQEPVRDVDRLLQRLPGDERDQRGEEDQVSRAEHPAPGQAQQQLDGQQQQRREHHQQDREGDDVEARGAAGGEELRVVTQEVEERLRDGEGPEHGEVEEVPHRLLRQWPLGRRRGRPLAAHQPFGRA